MTTERQVVSEWPAVNKPDLLEAIIGATRHSVAAAQRRRPLAPTRGTQPLLSGHGGLAGIRDGAGALHGSGAGGGESGWSFVSRLRLALTAVTSFSSFPLRLLTLGGLVFLALSGLLGLQTLFLWLSGEALSGFTTVILLNLIIGGAVIVGLGVIGEYVARIYEEVKGRPRFVESERVGVRSNAPLRDGDEGD